MAVDSIRAFSNDKYDYYKLKKDFGTLKAGAIFYHDPDDDIYGSTAQGCLKLCWTPDGNCYGGIVGGSVVVHYTFAKTDWFEKIELVDTLRRLGGSLEPGVYTVKVKNNGSCELYRDVSGDEGLLYRVSVEEEEERNCQ